MARKKKLDIDKPIEKELIEEVKEPNLGGRPPIYSTVIELEEKN